MKDQYIVKVKDAKGIVWAFEGTIQGYPIFTFAHVAKPCLLSLNEARDVEMKHGHAGETFLIERA